MRAHARAASQPAWPAPTTTTSYFAGRIIGSLKTQRFLYSRKTGDIIVNVLIIGGGGREHALAWRLAKSPKVKAVYATPGNPGIARVARLIPAEPNVKGWLDAAAAINADLTVVGPEAPLVAGIVDAFQAAGRLIVGPTRAAAQLEGSKIFAKEFMDRAKIPTAGFVTAHTEAEAMKALDCFGCPVVLKADGLAAGKGVVVANTRAEAEAAVRGLLSGALVGSAGSRLVIEEFLAGEEVSFIVLADGKDFVALAPTQDHKAVHDGDTGPNTGGMGAYCDARILTADQRAEVLDRVIRPAIAQMRADGTPFTGFLYAGLMMTPRGVKVLEFNVRLGDPETQPLMHSLDSDLAEVLEAAARGSLGQSALTWKQDPSVCVVLAAAGYPATPRSGDAITGIEQAEARGATVFQAGTRAGSRGVETSGGRVLGVTASAATLEAAIARAYASVEQIHFDGMHFRTDIGRKGLKRWPAAVK
jgi:phosphoribosylamine--glycine ligase